MLNKQLPSQESEFSRPSNRTADEMRPVTMETNVNPYAEGSCLISVGHTKVLCTASVDERVPTWMRYQNIKGGWVTAEYGMLPRATHDRVDREAAKGKQQGRTVEIQRLIGRTLRSVIDLEALGSRTIWLDCDVLQADGGTRTAAITGAFVALHIAIQDLMQQGKIKQMPLQSYVAAISCGVCGQTPVLDLDYAEDSSAVADGNFVMTQNGNIVEVQTTAEKNPLSTEQFQEMMRLAQKGISEMIRLQMQATGELSAAQDALGR